MIFYKEKENMKKVMKMFVGLIAVVLFTACNNGADGEVNNIPTANAGIDVLVEVNTPVTVTGTASDSDGTIVDVEWKEGTTVLSTTLSFDYIPTTVGTHILTLTVMDDEGATASDEVNIKATPTPNQSPTANAGVDKTVTVNESVNINGTANDPDGMIVDVEWTENGNTIATTLLFSYTPTTTGEHSLTLTVMDDDGATASDSMTVTANATPNQRPTANAGVDKTVTVNESVDINGTANDPDGMIVDVDWSENGNTIATTLSFSYTPTTTGEHNLTLTVMDDDGATASDSMTVTANAAAVSNPTISMADQTVDDNGGALATDLPAPTVTDVQAGAVYSIVTGTTGLTINSSTGVMTYDNDINPSQSFSITIKVTNPDGGNASTTFTLNVNDNA